jgi:hypothetical protein
MPARAIFHGGPTRCQLIARARWLNAAISVQANFAKFVCALELAQYNPGQPRVPSGSSDGGQWTDGAGAPGSGEGYSDSPSALLVPVVDLRPGLPIPQNLAAFGLKTWIMQDTHPTRGWLPIIRKHAYPAAQGKSEWKPLITLSSQTFAEFIGRTIPLGQAFPVGMDGKISVMVTLPLTIGYDRHGDPTSTYIASFIPTISSDPNAIGDYELLNAFPVTIQY